MFRFDNLKIARKLPQHSVDVCMYGKMIFNQI